MGRHQPPTNRSLYLSVAASTIRFAIIVALVVGGIVVINQAFPEVAGAGGGVTTGGGNTTGTSPPPTKTHTRSNTQAPTPSPQVAGVKIAVFNGAGVTGLAGDVTTALEGQGYIAAQDPADAPSDIATTTLYYRSPQDQVEAEYLANTFFKKVDGVVVTKLSPGTEVDRTVQVAIFLGHDYASIA
jgi:hypothetical protein